jgi:hypothetical protein
VIPDSVRRRIVASESTVKSCRWKRVEAGLANLVILGAHDNPETVRHEH